MQAIKSGPITIARWNGGLIVDEYLWSDNPKL
jgi:alpha-L-arabinofuranosidase